MRLFSKVLLYLCLSLVLALSACKPKAEPAEKPETPIVLTDASSEVALAEDLQTELAVLNEEELDENIQAATAAELYDTEADNSDNEDSVPDDEASDEGDLESEEASDDDESVSDEATIPQRGQEIQVKAPQMRSIGTQDVLAKQSTVNLLIPANGESTRFPKDFIVGDLDISEEFTSAGQEAWKLLHDVLKNGSNSKAVASIDPLERDYILDVFSTLTKPQLRLGSPDTAIREEVSFLIRIFDAESSISGEVFLASEEDGWTLKDIYLEEVLSFDDPEMQGVFDPFSYKRFFQE